MTPAQPVKVAAKTSAGGVRSPWTDTQSFTANITPWVTNPSTNYCSEDI